MDEAATAEAQMNDFSTINSAYLLGARYTVLGGTLLAGVAHQTVKVRVQQTVLRETEPTGDFNHQHKITGSSCT